MDSKPAIENSDSFFSLFWKVFLYPRKTIKVILGVRLNYGVVLILIISAFLEMFIANHDHVPYFKKYNLLFNLFAVPAFGILKYFFSWAIALFLLVVGKAFGGKATIKELFKVVIWTMPPDLIGKLFFVVAGLLFWVGMTNGGNANVSGIDPAVLSQYFFRALATGMMIWGTVISVIILSEVQKFSIGRSIIITLIFIGFVTGVEMLMGRNAIEVLIHTFDY